MATSSTMVFGAVIITVFCVTFAVLLFMLFRHLKAVIDWCKKSLIDPQTGNPSSKRLSGLWMMVLVTAIHAVWLKKAFITGDFSLLSEILWADLAFVISALGISAWQTKGGLSKATAEQPTATEQTPA